MSGVEIDLSLLALDLGFFQRCLLKCRIIKVCRICLWRQSFWHRFCRIFRKAPRLRRNHVVGQRLENMLQRNLPHRRYHEQNQSVITVAELCVAM